MAKLLFYDDTHTYVLDDEELPSVSEVSRFASREVYGEVSQYALDNACSRGSAVHKATEILDKYGTVECEEDIVPYVQAYVQFRKDFSVGSYFAIEKALANEELKYAGTIDRIYTIDDAFVQATKSLCIKKVIINEQGRVEKVKCEIDLTEQIGNLAIIDLKSSSSVQNVLAIIQLNAYALAVEQNGLGKVGALFILHLDKEGNYELLCIDINTALFMACLTLHKALQKKSRKKKEN